MPKHSLFLAFACALLLAVPSAAQTQTADVAGKWSVAFNTGQETIPATLAVTKQGEKLAATIQDGRAPERGELPVAITVSGNTIGVEFDYADAEGPMHIVMKGTVEKDTMSGTVQYGARGEGDWTAKRAATAGGASGAGAAKVDVTGTWSGGVTTDSFSASPTIVLKQDGEKLTGQYVSTQYGSFPLSGTVKGASIAFNVEMTIEGNSITGTFAGTVEKDAMSGTVHYGDFAQGTFTAKKK